MVQKNNASMKLPDVCEESLSSVMKPEFFKALCDPVRISIVANLATQKAPVPVTDIAGCCGIDFSGVSRHLKILKDAEIVEATKEGRSVLYALRSKALVETLRGLALAIEGCASAVD